MYFKKISINNLNEFQERVIPQLPNESLTMPGVMPQWHDRLIKILEIQKVITELKFEDIATHVCIVTMPPNSELPIHIDGGISKAALNIPLLNCNGTYTRWYSSTETPVSQTHHGKGTYLGVDRECCQQIAISEMNSPCIININQLHDAHNPNDTWRILLSIRLKNYQF